MRPETGRARDAKRQVAEAAGQLADRMEESVRFVVCRRLGQGSESSDVTLHTGPSKDDLLDGMSSRDEPVPAVDSHSGWKPALRRPFGAAAAPQQFVDDDVIETRAAQAPRCAESTR